MKKIVSISSLFIFLLFAPRAYAVNEVCTAGSGACPNPPNASLCTAPPIIQNVGGCPGGTVWIGSASTGQCTTPSYSPSAACTAGTDAFYCETNKCWTKPTPGPAAVCPQANVNTGSSLPCCTGNQIAVRDETFPTGWKCSDTIPGLWLKFGTNIYYNDGKVGIGTATPDSKLDVEFGINQGGVAEIGSFNNSATGSMSMAFGYDNLASGNYSTAFGYYSTAQPQNSFVVGRFNEISGTVNAWIGTEPLFVIGNGASAAAPNNALTVLKNGNVGINTATPTSTLTVNGPISSTQYCISGGSCMTAIPAGAGTYVGVTLSTYNGNRTGYAAANNLCALGAGALAGSHICTASEIITSYNTNPTGPIASLTEDVWINDGPPGYIVYRSNDCNGWQLSDAKRYGSTWSGGADASFIAPCNQSIKFACCK